ncbi:MAG: hypothetical protein ABI939_04070 [Anaerolineaceae bacterium]
MPDTPGQTFKKAILATYDPNLAESVLVDEVARAMDAIASLPETAHKEIRMQQGVVMRGISLLNLPDPAGAGVALTASQKGSRAANARWAAVRNAGVSA